MKSFNRPSKTSANSTTVQRKSQPTKGLIDNRPTAVIQRKLQQVANASPRVLQAKFGKGLPDQLKANLEAQSGYSLDDVQVHYNSSKPAEVGALAYAQGNEIYLGPGQEKHLAHEAWHVVQQKQGRVRATIQLKGGIAVNDNVRLEQEADRMGVKAISDSVNANQSIKQLREKKPSGIIQAKWVEDTDTTLRWNGLLHGVQWFAIIKGENKGKMYYTIENENLIPPDHLESYKAHQKELKSRDFFVSISEFGDIYGELDSQIISREKAKNTPPEFSMTEKFLDEYAGKLTEITKEVKAMNEIIARVIATEKKHSDTHFIFYHATAKASRIMMEFNKAKGSYENDHEHILNYFREPSVFADKNKPNTIEQAKEILSKQEADHGSVRSHILSLSTSLFSNFKNNGESTLYFFMNNMNISTPWKDQMNEKLPKPTSGRVKETIKAKQKFWESFNKLSNGGSGVLYQIIIPKDLAEQIVLVSTAGGTPTNMSVEEAFSQGPKEVEGKSEHLQGRLLLTSDETKKNMDQIIVKRYKFGEVENLDDKIKKLLKPLLATSK